MARLPVDPRVARLLVVANTQRRAARRARDRGRAQRRRSARVRRRPRRRAPQARGIRGRALGVHELLESLGGVPARAARRRARAAQLGQGALSLRRAACANGTTSTTSSTSSCRRLRWRTRQQAADYRAIHQAVLAAFIDFIAEHDDGLVYRGMRESRAQLFAGTPLAKKRPRWLVAAERVATERQYLRTVAQVNPRWALRVAPHLVRFEYDDPQWDVGARPGHGARGRDAVRPDARERAARRLRARRAEGGAAASSSPRRSRPIRSGFKAGEPAFLAHNRAVRRAVLEAEARLRKRDLFVGEAGIAAFYDERLPAGVHDRASLARGSRRATAASST